MSILKIMRFSTGNQWRNYFIKEMEKDQKRRDDHEKKKIRKGEKHKMKKTKQ